MGQRLRAPDGTFLPSPGGPRREGAPDCTGCGTKDPVAFYPSRPERCKRCIRDGQTDAQRLAYKRAWHAANRAKQNARRRAAYHALTLEERRAQEAARDPGSRRLTRQRTRPERLMRQQAREARKRGQFVENVHPLAVLERDDGVCGICDSDVDPFDFHVDHVIPLSAGGEHSYANVQVAHPICNLRKGDRW